MHLIEERENVLLTDGRISHAYNFSKGCIIGCIDSHLGTPIYQKENVLLA